MRFNKEQAKSLSGFFFDVAKGLVLGGIGLSIVTPLEVRLVAIIVSSSIAFACIKIGLSFLEGIR